MELTQIGAHSLNETLEVLLILCRECGVDWCMLVEWRAIRVVPRNRNPPYTHGKQMISNLMEHLLNIFLNERKVLTTICFLFLFF